MIFILCYLITNMHPNRKRINANFTNNPYPASVRPYLSAWINIRTWYRDGTIATKQGAHTALSYNPPHWYRIRVKTGIHIQVVLAVYRYRTPPLYGNHPALSTKRLKIIYSSPIQIRLDNEKRLDSTRPTDDEH